MSGHWDSFQPVTGRVRTPHLSRRREGGFEDTEITASAGGGDFVKCKTVHHSRLLVQ